jgi:hypothetical protein
MSNEPNHLKDFNSPYQSRLTFCSDTRDLSVISEDEKETLRLVPAYTETADSFDHDLFPYRPFDSVTGSLDYQARPTPAGDADEAVIEVALDQLNRFDQLVIETAHSVYHFTVVNPQLLYGKLIGGILGNQSVGATLKFSCSEGEAPILTDERLKLGLSIVFNLEWGNTIRQLITSSITRLLLRSAHHANHPATISEIRVSNSSLITLRMDEVESDQPGDEPAF